MSYLKNLKSRSTWVVVLAILCLASSSEQASDIKIFDLKGLKIRKNAPGEFVFNLDKGENCVFKYRVGDKGDVDDITLELIDLNGREARLVKTITRSPSPFEAPQDGNYLLRATTSKKSVVLDIKAESGFDRSLDFGSTTQALKCNGIYIEEGQLLNKTIGNEKVNKKIKIKGNTMKMYLDKLKPGDQVVVSCSDKGNSLIKAVLTQTSEAKWLNAPATFIIEENGNYSIDFYVEQNDKVKTGINIFRSENFYFTNLEVNITRLPKPKKGSPNRPTTFATMDEPEEEEEPFDFLLVMQDMQSTSAEERERARTAMENSQSDQAKALSEMFGLMHQKKLYYEPTVDDREITIELDAKKNIGGTQCDCEELEVFDVEQNLWFYWMGVDQKADSIFSSYDLGGRLSADFEDDFRKLFRNDSSSVNNVESINRVLRKNFPQQRYLKGYFDEMASFVILDEYNMERYKEGLSVEPYYSFLRQARTGHSVQALPIPDTDIWLCAKNKNEFMPVKLVMKYYTLHDGAYESF